MCAAALSHGPWLQLLGLTSVLSCCHFDGDPLGAVLGPRRRRGVLVVGLSGGAGGGVGGTDTWQRRLFSILPLALTLLGGLALLSVLIFYFVLLAVIPRMGSEYGSCYCRT